LITFLSKVKYAINKAVVSVTLLIVYFVLLRKVINLKMDLN